MRLIDADELMDVILSSKKLNSECVLEENAVDTYDNGQQETFELVIKMVEDRPTAYDIDKVVEQLEKNSKKMSEAKSNKPFGKASPSCHNYYKAISVKKAIEIVRGGENEWD